MDSGRPGALKNTGPANRIRGLAGLICLFISALVAAPAWSEPAEENPCDEDRGVLNLIAENDLWGRGTDRHFTHGTRFSYVSRNLSEDCQKEEEPGLWERFRNVVRDKVPLIPEMNKSVFSLVVGQSIFTPEDIARPDLVFRDRPYAGWLYAGLGFTGEHQEEWGKYFDNFELDIGVVGPGSLAEYIQEGWHDIINATDPEGWNHQLENEPGILLTYERKWRPNSLNNDGSTGLQFDFMPHAGVALGNVFTYGAVGGTLRIGMHLDADYGPPRIRPGVQGSDFFGPPDGSFGWYVFA